MTMLLHLGPVASIACLLNRRLLDLILTLILTLTDTYVRNTT